jgi:hypothetical protein
LQANRGSNDEQIKLHAEKLLKQPQPLDSTTLLIQEKQQLLSIPAISTRWLDFELHGVMQRLSFLPYAIRNDAAALQLMNHDLALLLRFKHHVFWSYVLLEPSFGKFLDTFLRNCR